MRQKIRLLALFILVLLIGVNAYQGLTQQYDEINVEWQTYTPGGDPYSGWDQRLKRLANHLPEHGVIGYFSDTLIPGIQTNDSEQNVEYYLTRYTLTPLVLHWNTDEKIAVANMGSIARRDQIEQLFSKLHYRIIFELDPEIFLVQKTD